jgi:hypothetical protein
VICCDFLRLLMFFSVQSNGSEIELCHAVSWFCTVRSHVDVHQFGQFVCCDVVREVCLVLMLCVDSHKHATRTPWNSPHLKQQPVHLRTSLTDKRSKQHDDDQTTECKLQDNGLSPFVLKQWSMEKPWSKTNSSSNIATVNNGILDMLFLPPR